MSEYAGEQLHPSYITLEELKLLIDGWIKDSSELGGTPSKDLVEPVVDEIKVQQDSVDLVMYGVINQTINNYVGTGGFSKAKEILSEFVIQYNQYAIVGALGNITSELFTYLGIMEHRGIKPSNETVIDLFRRIAKREDIQL